MIVYRHNPLFPLLLKTLRLFKNLVTDMAGEDFSGTPEEIAELKRRIASRERRLNREAARKETPRKARFHHNRKANC
jgi:hypothetical protein